MAVTTQQLAALLAPHTPTDSGAGTDDEAMLPATPNLRLTGFSVRETAGSTASFIIHNGDGAGDPAVFTYALAANQGESFSFGEGGIPCPDGIFLERVTGNVQVITLSKVIPS